MAPKSIMVRKLDLFYWVFFATHIPVVLFIDSIPLWPKALVPVILKSIREYYISTYRDQFFIEPPSWFGVYVLLEVVYHLPVCLWMLGALLRDDALVPLYLLVFGIETAMSTLTCLVEMLSWGDRGYTREELGRLGGLYVPYLVIAVIMSVDGFTRVRRVLKGKEKMV